MQTYFPLLKDFFKNHRNCIFCGNKLKTIFTNFIGVKSSGHALLSSKPKNNSLQFFIRYEPFNDDLTEVKINIDNNVLTSNANKEHTSSKLLLECIKKIAPHLESYCHNRSCKAKHKYYLSTEVLEFDSNKEGIITIKPCNLYSEAFNIGNLWIQNDYSTNELNIFNRENLELPPLKYKMINFEGMDKERILSKVMMMATFS